MKCLLLLLLNVHLLFSTQTDEKYLAGAVPEENGKVVFSRTVNASSLSHQQIYNTLLEWAQKRFNSDKNRVAYQNKEEGELAAVGEEYVVFTNTALSLDRSLILYQMIVECKDHSYDISVKNIRYIYDVPHKREPERYTAEAWISDSKALSNGKLNRQNSKFRMATIDYINDLFDDAEAALGRQSLTQSTPVVAAGTNLQIYSLAEEDIISPSTNHSMLEGYRQIAPGKIPGNIIKMLSEDWMLITAGNDLSFNMMTASWGGLGFVLGKPVAFCFINPARYTYQLMEKNDTYTLTFYTEAYKEALQYCGSTSGKDTDKVKGSGLTPLTTPSGSKAFGEAWMIIECRKLISQSLSTEAIGNETVRNEWLGKQMHKMYIGEIINIWIK
ncbi:MAG: DUF4468 domain-containing protein [Tannerellaceae bacterium]|nr:DUF4468 domain-containing protein [Tannerellaceae bacterium]